MVNRGTRLKFDFALIEEAEAHVICIDEDISIDSK